VRVELVVRICLFSIAVLGLLFKTWLLDRPIKLEAKLKGTLNG
jgi:hypothetical protein